ncbi:MAG TPA: 4Fe-4S dicluster domain-containing protein, partial [Polyangiales bacterium]
MNRMSVPASGDPRAAPGVAALADQCVMCGLCLPHCPTYRLEQTEAESPRGRIALARALAEGRLEPDAEAVAHLDHCLGCLSCQQVCPSQVRYEDLLVQTRAALAAARPPAAAGRWL